MLGRSVGNYGVVSKIGEGGMGVVYLARHMTLGRPAAVKVLRPALSSNQDIVARFFDEARAATAVRNPGIVDVYDCGFLEDRTAYIIMEYLDGESLAARLRRGGVTIAWTLKVARAIGRALQAAHEQGIVHRDLKPDNVFLIPDSELPDGERVKLLDFGIAKLTHRGGSHTTTGTVMGTPTYMAPEQCRGAGTVDHRADLYSLGCVVYEMLCGQPPFVADGSGDVIARHLYFDPSSLRSYNPEIPVELEDLVLRLLKKDPQERYSTATEVVRAIGLLMTVAPLAAMSTGATITNVSATHGESTMALTSATTSGARVASVTTVASATVPMATQTTLSGAVSSGAPRKHEPGGHRRAIFAGATAVALGILIVMFFFGRGTGEYKNSHAATAAPSTEPRESETTAPPADLPPNPTMVPPDAGSADAAPATDRLVPRIASTSPDDELPPPDRMVVHNSPRARTTSGAPNATAPHDGRAEFAVKLPVLAESKTADGPLRSSGGTRAAASTVSMATVRMANPSGIGCAPAVFTEVLGVEYLSEIVIVDALGKLRKCQSSMDSGLYEDIQRRLIGALRSASDRHNDLSPAPLQLTCSLPMKQATAGQTLHVPCEASNQGERPVKGMVYRVAVGAAPPLLTPGPTDLLPHAAPSKFEVDVALPPDAKPGSLTVVVTGRGPDVPPVRQEVSAEVIEPVEPTKLCAQGELTTKDYRKKRLVLEEQRMAGSITQEEFNDILAEWWSCVRQH